MEATVLQRIIDAYRKFSRIPVPVSGNITFTNPAILNVNIINGHRDLERSEKIKSHRTFICNSKNCEIIAVTAPIDITSEQLRTDNSTGTKTAIIRLINLNRTEDKQFLEIWENSEKLINLDLKALDHHGKVYEDSQFGSLQWSSDDKKVVYIAEKRRPSTESFFKTKSGNSKESADIVPGNEHIYVQDWGEALVNKSHSVPFVLDIETMNVKPVENLPDNISFGQAFWTPENNIVCVGFWHEPRRLGITYCPNRKSAIFHLLINEKKYEIIGSTDHSVDSPRFSNFGSMLVYLQREAGGPHHRGAKLMLCHWETKQVEVLVDLVNHSEGDSFPGIYALHLPNRVWSSDNNWLIFHSIWRSKEELICVNVKTKTVSKLTSDRANCSWNLLDIYGNNLLATISSPQLQPICVIGKFVNPEKVIYWAPLWEEKIIPNVAWKILKLVPTTKTVHPNYPNLQYEAIFIHPINPLNDSTPLILWPHGGPHSTHLASYSLYIAAIIDLGFSVLLVNFRGSLGFGEDSIDSLLGNIGVNDVHDCQNAIQTLSSEINFKNIVVFGGSHGGYLSLHLTSQFPDFYKACACRNPVVDLSALVSVSDIPDWNWVEAGLNYEFKSLPSSIELSSMLEKSPIRHINQVKTPVLLLIGKIDLRVPCSQSYVFYHALKARNKEVKMFTYEDNHSLSKVDVEADVFVNTILWFLNHLNK